MTLATERAELEGWQLVIHADECAPCELCGSPVCPECGEHYADCPCPGPTQDDAYEYRWIDGVMYARPFETDEHDD